MKAWLQRVFINRLARHLFNFVDPLDILRQEGGSVFFRNRILGQDVVKKLGVDAREFGQSTLWQIFLTDIRDQANQRMFDKAKGVEDILAGKMQLVNLDIIERRLQDLTKL